METNIKGDLLADFNCLVHLKDYPLSHSRDFYLRTFYRAQAIGQRAELPIGNHVWQNYVVDQTSPTVGLPDTQYAPLHPKWIQLVSAFEALYDKLIVDSGKESDQLFVFTDPQTGGVAFWEQMEKARKIGGGTLSKTTADEAILEFMKMSAMKVQAPEIIALRLWAETMIMEKTRSISNSEIPISMKNALNKYGSLLDPEDRTPILHEPDKLYAQVFLTLRESENQAQQSKKVEEFRNFLNVKGIKNEVQTTEYGLCRVDIEEGKSSLYFDPESQTVIGIGEKAYEIVELNSEGEPPEAITCPAVQAELIRGHIIDGLKNSHSLVSIPLTGNQKLCLTSEFRMENKGLGVTKIGEPSVLTAAEFSDDELTQSIVEAKRKAPQSQIIIVSRDDDLVFNAKESNAKVAFLAAATLAPNHKLIPLHLWKTYHRGWTGDAFPQCQLPKAKINIIFYKTVPVSVE